jgi:hypothetical protein
VVTSILADLSLAAGLLALLLVALELGYRRGRRAARAGGVGEAGDIVVGQVEVRVVEERLRRQLGFVARRRVRE